jgi:hypothetical protein
MTAWPPPTLLFAPIEDPNRRERPPAPARPNRNRLAALVRRLVPRRRPHQVPAPQPSCLRRPQVASER